VKKLSKYAPFVGVITVALAVIAWSVFTGDEPRDELTLDQFQAEIEADHVVTADILEKSRRVTGELQDGTRYKVEYIKDFGDELVVSLIDADPAIKIDVDHESTPRWESLLYSMLPLIILIGAFGFFITQMQGGGKMGKFGKATAYQPDQDASAVTFADVAGADEAVEELREIKDFLEDPNRFASLGAAIPKGVLLFGPPGTGKTLLARAVAGEAGVPFYSISGSDFVEMYVGIGASRVRNLFKQAKETAPAIIFIDEIDAVGRHRGAGVGGGHDEREQTLNQLLVEMDGFDAATGVILIAATNRSDILDPALLRPGRFDRQIVIDAPDVKGRKQILEVHAKGKPLGDGVDLERIAQRTPGFTGADLQNLLNEAALLTVRERRTSITMADIANSVDRVIAGPERKSRLMSDEDKRVIAYHEAGHALVGHLLPECDRVHKVTIIPRGRALGWTMALPDQERFLHTKPALEQRLSMLLGGRTAEELVFNQVTTGAVDDIERATDLARSMVTEFGMSELLGLRKLGQRSGEVFLGKSMGHDRDYGDDVAEQVDAEIGRIIEAAHIVATDVLTTHRDTLDKMADALIEHETLDLEELGELFAGITAL